MYCEECQTEEGTPHKPDCKLGKLERIVDGSDKPFVKDDAAATNSFSNGDIYDVDTGEYLGSFELSATDPLPVQLEILHNGFWYQFKVDGRVKQDDEVPTNKEGS